ncbi:MAG: hypothetical protein GX931_01860 [Acholeplasmataceae bacterium]|nr:hypothetical protein [Acholeplasmataceae bacterium]
MPRKQYEDEPKKEEKTGIRLVTPEEMLHLKLNSIIERLDFLIASLPKEEEKK